MTDREIKSYVFKPTNQFDTIKKTTEMYLDFYKQLGIDAPGIMRFSAGSAPVVAKDKNNETTINPGAGSNNSIIQVVNEKLISGYIYDIKGAVKLVCENDGKRKNIEYKDLKIAKKANKKARKIARQDAQKERREARKNARKERRKILQEIRKSMPHKGFKKLFYFFFKSNILTEKESIKTETPALQTTENNDRHLPTADIKQQTDELTKDNLQAVKTAVTPSNEQEQTADKEPITETTVENKQSEVNLQETETVVKTTDEVQQKFLSEMKRTLNINDLK